ncbi:MAG: hypothetical protein ACLUUO_14510 [Sellimonas intestinalis]
MWQAVSVVDRTERSCWYPCRRLGKTDRTCHGKQSSGAPSAFSLVRILGGFFLAAAAGILAAGLSAKFERIREFLLLR